jgi:hypothetical protein
LTPSFPYCAFARQAGQIWIVVEPFSQLFSLVSPVSQVDPRDISAQTHQLFNGIPHPLRKVEPQTKTLLPGKSVYQFSRHPATVAIQVATRKSTNTPSGIFNRPMFVLLFGLNPHALKTRGRPVEKATVYWSLREVW